MKNLFRAYDSTEEPPVEVRALRDEGYGYKPRPFLVRGNTGWLWSEVAIPMTSEVGDPWKFASGLAKGVLRVVATDSRPKSTSRGEVLLEAKGLIEGDRNKTYGKPTENFDRTAALWNVQLGHKLRDGEKFTATDVALLMVQLKMARTVTQPKRDNFVDAVGYLACGWECVEDERGEAS